MNKYIAPKYEKNTIEAKDIITASIVKIDEETANVSVSVFDILF